MVTSKEFFSVEKELEKLQSHLKYFERLTPGTQKKASLEQMRHLLTGLRSQAEWISALGLPGNFVGLSPENFAFRDSYTRTIGFCILTQELVEALGKFLEPRNTIEVGCGTGELAHQLLTHNAQLKLLAVDIGAQESKYGFQTRPFVVQADGPEMLAKEQGNYDTVLMSWPCYQSDFALNAAKAMPVGATLVHCFEDCTGTTEFYEYLANHFEQDRHQTGLLNCAHLQFPGMHDLWEVTVKVR